MKINVVDSIMGSGKAQPLNSLVLSENGYIKMKDVYIGTKVYGEDGELHNVIGVYPQGIKDVYKVTLSDNTYTYCCKEHLWTYQMPQDKAKNKYRTDTLEDIMNLDLYKETNKGKNWQIYIPITNPINFKKNDLPMHPYIIGALLGDGGLSGINGSGSVSFTNTEEDILIKINYLLQEMNDDFYLSQVSNSITYILRDKIWNNIHCNRIKKILTDLKMDCKSYDKFIPDIYKMSSTEDRLELLRGLVDTDGYNSGNGIEFSTSSGQLCKDIVFLIQSLGGTAVVSSRIPKYTYNNDKKIGALNYRIYIKMPKNLVPFSSIKHQMRERTKNTYPLRTIRSIEYVREEECQCILVDNPTHLYLTNDFIVTHNTSAGINYINTTSDDVKVMYVTPYLKEVERVIEACPNKHFKQPDKYGTKVEGIKYLLNKGVNIVTTHTLFHLFDDEIIELCYSQGYILFMDEVTEVVDTYIIGRDDLQMLLDNFVTVDNETGILSWRDDKENYSDAKFIKEKHLCEMGCLAIYGNNIMIWTFPIKIFNAFSESYILTYLFKAQVQKYYYDYHHLEYKYMYVKGEFIDDKHNTFELTDEKTNSENKYDYSKLINILQDDKLNKIGDLDYSLSMSWYTKHKSDVLMKTLKKNTYNYFHNITISPSSDNIWTTFKDYKEIVKGNGYAKGFVSSSARATNKYKDTHNVAYLINKYFNPYIKKFFTTNGIEVYEDEYALSEMLQFIWRAAIRQGEPINLYIPSKRMRNLLQQWIEENSQ